MKIYLLIFSMLLLNTSGSDLKFHHLTVDDGLSQGSIHAIAQDSYGLMWFGTKDGLNRYDGYNFTIYRHIPEDSTSLPANYITSVVIDSAGFLWIGSEGGGLARFNYKKNIFERIDLSSLAGTGQELSDISNIYIASDGVIWFMVPSYGLCSYNSSEDSLKGYSYLEDRSLPVENSINPIFEDHLKNIWIGSAHNGVIKYNPSTRKHSHYESIPGDENSVCNKSVTSIDEDEDGNVWIGTNDGLCRYDYGTDSFTEMPLVLGDLRGLGRIRKILCDEDKNIWMATLGAGLVRLNLDNHELSVFSSDPNDDFSVSNNTLETLFLDKTKAVWIGTNGMGVDIYFPYSKNFHTVGSNIAGSSSNGLGSIRAIYDNPDRTLWIAGYSGVVKFDKRHGIIESLPTESHGINSRFNTNFLINKAVYSMLPDPEDPEGILWIGTEGSGLLRYDVKQGSFKNFFFDGEKYSSLGLQIYKIIPALDGNLWLGINDGLAWFNTGDYSFKIYKNDPDDDSSIAAGMIKTIAADNKNNLWVGSDQGGLSLFDSEANKFIRFGEAHSRTRDLSGGSINDFFQDSKGRYWVATSVGLKRFYYPENRFKLYDTGDGLANNFVYGILEDENGLLWLSTNNGLSSFDPEKEAFRNYTKSDGLQGNEFNGGAFYKDAYGNLYFGGTNGLTYFKASEIKENPFPPSVILTSISILRDSMIVFDNVENRKQLEINYDDNIIRFQVSALNYQNPENNSYAYKLEGFNDKWIYTGGNRDITFTSLYPGKYTLKVKASNNDGVWNSEGIQLEILVSPPFWQKLWFITLAALFIILSFYLYLNLRLRKIQNQRENLEKVVEQRTGELEKSRQELEDANNAKDKFFSIVAHDMKNPFISLLGLSEVLMEDFEELSDEEKKEYIEGIAGASKSAYNLLENLLDWSRIQMNRVEITKEKVSLNKILDNNITLNEMSAKNKDITLVKSYKDDYNIYVDKYTFDTIIRNLLTNAIKFTKSEGKVEIQTKELQDSVLISIIDSGIGMSAEMQANLFQLKNSQVSFGTGGEKGVGLGLILCKEFAEANGGKIFVESELGRGSKFSLTIPKAI